ncbi:MarR family transcriptional regulator, partial [Streptomyces rubellomurinus subsp. indigoferus]
FGEDLLQDLAGEDRTALSGLLARMLRRIEETQPDALGRTADLAQ